MRLTLIFRVVSFLYLSIALALAVSLSKPGCPDKCGNVGIPYPFGIGSECSADSSFTVICQNSTFGPKPFLSSINLELLNISIDSGTVRVMQQVSPLNCSDELMPLSLGRSLLGSPFTISALQNSLALLGCSNSIWLLANTTTSNATTIRGCMAICDANSTDTSCNGVNCCQTLIPKGLQQLQFFYNRTIEISNNASSCGYAFLAERKWFREDYETYKGLHNNLSNPFDEGFKFAAMVLEWELDNITLSNYSFCGYSNATSTTLYSNATITRLCYCRPGFEGNPYLPGGCQDIDECSNSTWNHCTGTCINGLGFYTCESGSNKAKIAFIGVGSGLGVLLLLIGALGSYRVIKKRIKANRKKKFFTRNGGLLLEQQLSSTDNGVEKTKLFSTKELAKATDQYNENRVLGCGGQGTVYKGMLVDGRIVAVKKSKKLEEGDIEVFINEVVILSQINHRNVVKLLGCCLETEVPLLVYEFIPNGTLFQHIHDPNEELPLTWEMRVRIATEVARAISYLHSSASSPIYHRDIKSANILLDDKYRAKVADFGTSRSISIDQTHLTTRVFGTFGYLDPEYFQSSQFTEKSDVYSFGVVMVELLTGEKAVSSIRAEVGRSLATHFLHSMEENQLLDILDARVLKEGRREEIVAIAELARRCLNLNGKRRPTMREVAVELEGIQISKEGSGFQDNIEDKEYHSVELYDGYDFSSNSSSMRMDTNSTHSSDFHPLLFNKS